MLEPVWSRNLDKNAFTSETARVKQGIGVGKTAALLLVLIFLAALNIVIAEPASPDERKENSWTTESAMPQTISGVKAAVVDGKIYVMGGTFNYEYNPATGNWTAKKPMPTPRIGSFGIAACQNKIYVIGGEDEALSSRGYYFLSTNEVYDPTTDTWETKKPMPTSRRYIEANVVHGKIYVIGGTTYASDNSNHSNDTDVNEVYDPITDVWETKQPALIAVDNYVSAVVGNKIYIMGGTSDQIYDGSLRWVSNQIYDVETDTWSFGASLPNATYFAAACVTTGSMAPKRIYTIGGGFTEATNVVNVYDPASDNWTSGTPMPTKRSSLAVGIVNDIVYAMGGSLGWEGGDWPFTGYSLGTTDAVEAYTPIGYGTIPPKPESEPFPTSLVIATSGILVTVVGVGLLVYFKKRKH
jgi:N-acetylneuraminic acid mutarotase